MKKIIVLCLSLLLLVCGCGKTSKEDIINDFTKSVEGTKAYKLTGTMEILNDEDTFKYNLEAYYLKDNYYKVILVNQTNNHEQVILRNDDGVYVITPSLNKSFKFDSVWPENSSQSYLLKPLLNDVTNDQSAEVSEDETNYIIKSTVNYPNNSELSYQKIYLTKDKIIDKVEVYNKDNQVKISVKFTTVDLKASLTKDDFALDNYIDEENNQNCEGENCDETTSSIEDIIYPLYVPTNTYLTSSDTINNETTQRVILTFTGDKNFVLIEEKATVESEFEIIPIYGDPLIINDTVGALSTNSMYWASNGKDYYLVSNDLTTEELVNVASSLNNNTTVSASK